MNTTRILATLLAVLPVGCVNAESDAKQPMVDPEAQVKEQAPAVATDAPALVADAEPAATPAEAAQEQAPADVAKAAEPAAHAPIAKPAAAPTTVAKAKPASIEAVAAAINPFGLHLLSKAAASAPDKNMLVSPFSLASAFAILTEGARGDTLALLHKQLGLDAAGLSATAIGDLGKQIADGGDGATLVVANSVWLAQDLDVEPAFVESGKTAFDAAIETIDFSAAGTLKHINGWFSEKTAGKIPELLATLDSTTRFVLGNALHFKGTWMAPFDPAKTTDTVFHAPGGDITVPTLHKLFKEASYRKTDAGQAIRLPFGDGRFDMTFILPAQGKAAAEQLVPAADGKLDWLGAAWKPERVEVAMPKFEIATGGSLTETLKAAGLQSLFAQSDLSGISKQPLVVSEVAHKVVLAVDESGAEAAAATAIVAVRSVDLGREPVEFTVDRPFAVLIRHVPSNALIVAGVINDPPAK